MLCHILHFQMHFLMQGGLATSNKSYHFCIVMCHCLLHTLSRNNGFTYFRSNDVIFDQRWGSKKGCKLRSSLKNAPLTNRGHDVSTDRCTQTIFEGHISDIVFANNNIIFVTHIEPVKNYTIML